MSTDWRYCKCGHKADDHNPCSLACYKCDCDKWRADLEKSRQILSFANKVKQKQTEKDRELYNLILARVKHLDL